MKIEVLGVYGGASLDCRMTSLLINDTIALDAGSLAQRLAFERQPRVRTIILTHSHWDHTNSLPFFVENVFDLIDAPIDIFAPPSIPFAGTCSTMMCGPTSPACRTICYRRCGFTSCSRRCR
jgi:ribonuclease BN (tRNA processing enzyme)